MSKYKRGKIRSYAIAIGEGNTCPHCHIPMQRRKRIVPPNNTSSFFLEWDYCIQCTHVQHYEEFKRDRWE